MALVESNTSELGAKAPDFRLLDTITAQHKGLDELQGENGTVVMFICNHCPYVKHVNKGLVAIAKEYQSKGIAFIAISSNDVKSHPEDGPVLMKKNAEEQGYPFPYLYDEDQSVAKAYDAACTPDIYLFDADLKAVYQGQLDDSRPGNDIPVTGKDLKSAMDALIDKGEPLSNQKPSIGCSIKWK